MSGDGAQTDVARVLAGAAYYARLPLALSGGLIAALAVFLTLSPAPARVATTDADLDVGAGVWTRASDARPALSLTSLPFAALPSGAAVWTRTRAGVVEVEDRLTVGDVDGNGPFVLAIVAHRPDGEHVPASLFLASARHAADAGLAVGRFTPLPEESGTRGLVEVGRIALARAVGFGPVRNDCVAWRTGRKDGSLRVEGVACLPGDRPDLERVACLMQDLAMGVSDVEPSLRRGLLEAAGQKTACAGSRPAAPKPPGWRVARTRQ